MTLTEVEDSIITRGTEILGAGSGASIFGYIEINISMAMSRKHLDNTNMKLRKIISTQGLRVNEFLATII